MRRPILGILLLSLVACDLPPAFPAFPSAVTKPSPTPPPTPSSIVIKSLSPSSVTAGSGEIRITIKGSGFLQASKQHPHKWSFVIWHGQSLDTKVVSTSQLTATVPASLLKTPETVQLLVVNGDVMGWSDGYVMYPRSNAIPFTVTE